MPSRGWRQPVPPISNPLFEVFGFPLDMSDAETIRKRSIKLCPFNNGKSAHCTKNSAEDPLGVCSIVRDNISTITCPIRFRQNWRIGTDAAAFFFQGISSPDIRILTEVRLVDKFNNSVGNIDVVVVRLEKGKIIDYGALEIQGTYISGNVTKPFKHYMEDQVEHAEMTWKNKGAPRADYLSSSRKRLAPQLRYKGYILNSWGHKLVIVVDQPFFDELRRVTPFNTLSEEAEAEMAWFVYRLQRNIPQTQYQLTLAQTVYSDFRQTLERINTPVPGSQRDFVVKLQTRVDTGNFYGTPEESEVPPDMDSFISFDND